MVTHVQRGKITPSSRPGTAATTPKMKIDSLKAVESVNFERLQSDMNDEAFSDDDDDILSQTLFDSF